MTQTESEWASKGAHKPTENGLKERTSAMASAVSDRAGDAAQRLSDAALSASEQVTSQVASEARSAVEEAAASRQRRAERYLQSIGSAIEAGSRKLDEDGLEATAAYTRKAARMIDGLNTEIDGADIASAARRAEDYMRERPVASFGAALLLGFAAYQIFKAGNSS